MKRINIAYSILREKLNREAAFRERQTYARAARRYSAPDARARGADARQGSENTEREAFSAINSYFKLLSACDYNNAYNYLSGYDKRYITRESFIQWRKSVARVYPMREYKVTGGLPIATLAVGDGRLLNARRFSVNVTEENIAEQTLQSGSVDKLVVNDNGIWKVFLGYKNVGELTRTFDEKLQAKRKEDIAAQWKEYYAGLSPEYNMLSIAGLRKAASREIYRQKRFGGALTFAAISLKAGGAREAGQEELLYSAARTISNALRETDVPAYAGGSVFAILFVELQKKNVEEIIARLVEKIRRNAGAQLGRQANIEYAFESWSGKCGADIDSLNKVLKKLDKRCKDFIQ